MVVKEPYKGDWMLNHKFYLSGASKEDKDSYIRISDKFIEKIKPDLLRYKFTWSGYEYPRNGLSPDITVIKLEELNQIKCCLLKWSADKEYNKFMLLINRAIAKGKEIIHESGSPGSLVHDFIICSEFPEEIDYKDYKANFIKIQDQFIMENYDVFKTVELYWENTENKIGGFNYYGTTLITPQMAQELIDAMAKFLKDNDSEEAEYFVGEEYDILVEILNKAIADNKVIIHFGI